MAHPRRVPVLFSFLLPGTLAAQADGIYVSDAGAFFNFGPWQILHFDQAGQNPTDFITTELDWPQDILFLEDSNVVLVSNLNSGIINRHDATTGDYINAFATGIAGPTRMKVGPDGLLYVLQWQGVGLVRRYQLDGTYLGTFTSVGVPQSIGLDWDSVGNLYVSSYTADLVRRFDVAGGDLGIFNGQDLEGPTNIWFNDAGELMVADYDGGAVKRFAASGNYMDEFVSGVMEIEGVDHYADGRFLLGDGGTSSVKLFEADGTLIQDLVPSGSGGLVNPNVIVIRGPLTVGTPDLSRSAPNDPFVCNTGSVFTLRSDVRERIRTLRILDASGRLVEGTLRNTWDASAQPPGIYLAAAEWKDGTRTTQRLQVTGIR